MDWICDPVERDFSLMDSLTLGQLFDVMAPSCVVRKEALRILKHRGVQEGAKYLVKHGGNSMVLKLVEGLDTKDWRYVLS